MKRVLILAAVVLAAAGCGSGGKHATPEAAFDAMKAAAAKSDWKGVAGCMTAESQELLVGGMAMAGQFFAMGDKAKGEEFNALLKKHGIDMEKEMKDISAKGQGAKDPDAAKKSMQGSLQAVGAKVKDKPAAIAEIMQWMEKNSDKKGGNPMNEKLAGTLKDMKTTGDTATGKVVTKGKDGKDMEGPINFKKISGSWLIDLTAGM